MGSEVENTQNTSLKEYFDQLCAYAISIGMTYHEFWEEDTDILWYYHEAEKYRLKSKNRDMWLQGFYVYQAIGSLAPVLNGNAKHPKANPYIKQPIALTEEDRIEEENRKIAKFKEYLVKRAKEGK